MNREDIIWAAGLLEGEGYFCVDKSGQIRVTCVMTDEDVLLNLKEKIGGVVNVRPYTINSKNKTQYRWQLHGKDKIYVFIVAIYSFMGQRRKTKIIEMIKCYHTMCNQNHTKLKFSVINRVTKEIVHTKGLAMFCNKRNLRASNLSKVLTGKRTHHKDWIKYES